MKSKRYSQITKKNLAGNTKPSVDAPATNHVTLSSQKEVIFWEGMQVC